MTLARLGIWPFRMSGRITSSSMPLTPTTTTRGLGLAVLWACPNRGDAARESSATATENLRETMGNLTSCWDIAGLVRCTNYTPQVAAISHECKHYRVPTALESRP